MAETASRISVMLSNCRCLHGKELMTSRAPSSSLLAQMWFDSISHSSLHWSHSFSLMFSLILILCGWDLWGWEACGHAPNTLLTSSQPVYPLLTQTHPTRYCSHPTLLPGHLHSLDQGTDGALLSGHIINPNSRLYMWLKVESVYWTRDV